MRKKAEIWQSYRGTAQTKKKNLKAGKFRPGVRNGWCRMRCS